MCAFWKSEEEKRKKRERRGDIVIPGTEHYDKAVKLPSKNFHFASLRRGERVLQFWVTPPSRCNPCSGGESLAVWNVPNREIGSTLSPRWKPPGHLPRITLRHCSSTWKKTRPSNLNHNVIFKRDRIVLWTCFNSSCNSGCVVYILQKIQRKIFDIRYRYYYLIKR